MFHKEQMQFLGKFTKEFPELKLVKYNLQTLDLNQSEQKLALEADYERMNSKYNLSLYQ